MLRLWLQSPINRHTIKMICTVHMTSNTIALHRLPLFGTLKPCEPVRTATLYRSVIEPLLKGIRALQEIPKAVLRKSWSVGIWENISSESDLRRSIGCIQKLDGLLKVLHDQELSTESKKSIVLKRTQNILAFPL